MNGTKIQRGMKVQIGRRTNKTPADVWTVLERHPEKGHWWLHRRNDAGEWQTTFARFSELNQVFK